MNKKTRRFLFGLIIACVGIYLGSYEIAKAADVGFLKDWPHLFSWLSCVAIAGFGLSLIEKTI